MSRTNVKAPSLLEQVFAPHEFAVLEAHLKNKDLGSMFYHAEAGRYLLNDSADPVLREYGDKLVPLARRLFGSDTLLQSYTLFSRYEGAAANLIKHKDGNACTYTIDMCLYQKVSWSLFVEDVRYTLQPNQAAVYYGNDQWHWRDTFPEPDTNYVAMVFFHFVEPDHWYFTKGPLEQPSAAVARTAT